MVRTARSASPADARGADSPAKGAERAIDSRDPSGRVPVEDDRDPAAGVPRSPGDADDDAQTNSRTIQAMVGAVLCVAAALLVPVTLALTSAHGPSSLPTEAVPSSPTLPRQATPTTAPKRVHRTVPAKTKAPAPPPPAVVPTTIAAPVTQVAVSQPRVRHTAVTTAPVVNVPATSSPVTQPRGVPVPYTPTTQKPSDPVAVPFAPSGTTGG